ncbi:MAG: hypothetical protein HIU85_03325 [Proteobacteria bacterium]|nr:hypothetical protein [Pseudomonadota bacterium]
MQPPPSDPVRAFGAAVGAIFLSLFGAAWIILSLINGNFAPALYVPPVLITLLLLWRASIVLRRNAAAARSQMDPGYRRKIGRVFGIVNAVQWTLVFVAATLLPRFGLDWLIVPVIVIIVGLHFFPLARLFDRHLYYGTGIALLGWAVVIALVSRTTLVPMITAVGTGTLLWVTAAILMFQCGIL